MLAFFTARLLTMIASLLVASLAIFVMLDLVPGDPASIMLGLNATPEALNALREELGLNGPWPQRYLSWITGLLRGDFGVSYTYRVPVTGLILERLAISLPLALYALGLTVVLAFPVGMIAAASRKTWGDVTIMGLTQLGIAVPNFWFAIQLQVLFALVLRWLPAGSFPGWEAGLVPALSALTLPAFALALPQASILARVMRSSVLETLHQDYMRSARAKGLSRAGTLLKHGLRNALIPVLTIIGLQFAFLLAGAIIIENVFYLSGLGNLVFKAISQRDLIVVRACVMVLVFAVIAVNTLVDLAYGLVDPRLRRR